MAYPNESDLVTETAVEKRLPPWFGMTAFPSLAGAGVPSAAILWAHAENLSLHEAVYYVAPPTVSRALADPAISGPFAIAMIVGAILLLVAVVQIASAFVRFMRETVAADWISWALLVFVIICELPAILGMVVLSQYTGDAFAWEHDTGSYMLFFGHSFAIMAAGVLIRRVLSRADARDARVAALRRLPSHAAFVAVASAAFGIAYFSNKHWPDASPFMTHLILAIIEMIALLAFLSFLGRFWRFVHSARN